MQQVAADELPFYWWFDTQDDYTIPSCNTISIGFTLNPNASTASIPPYSLIAAPGGQPPSVFPVTISDFEERWSWQVAYPPGTQLLLNFVDSAGRSGGVGPLYSVVSGTVPNCQMYQQAASLSYTLNVTNQPLTCQAVGIEVNGGTPPYTLTKMVSADSAYNTSFPGSSLSYRNTLSGGATYMIALSDSLGARANTSSLTYSGGGSDTSCLTGGSDGPKSGTGNAGPPQNSGGGKGKNYTAIVGGVIAAVALAAMAAIFWYFRRRSQRHRQELLSATRGPWSGHPGNGSFGASGDALASSPGGGTFGRGEKFASPMGNPGGAWRPESPFEYPAGAHPPVRFRVTNPDDDGRSERSIVSDTTTIGNGSTRSGHPQRQSLIEGDHNSLYPPTTSTRRSGNRSGNGAPSYASDDTDQAWPTFASNASSTEDHYMDHPASSAGNIGSRTVSQHGPSQDSRTPTTRHPSKWSASSTELSSAEFGDDEDDSYTVDSHLSASESYQSRHQPGVTRTGSSDSNAYGSPFADSQRVQER